MRIGIYKPFKEVFFNDDANDVAAWSYEVVNTAKIFAERGHEIVILSETDLKEGQYQNISVKLVKDFLENEKFDRILLWSGSFQFDKYGDNIITILRKHTNRLDFVLTDKLLMPVDHSSLEKVDHIYIQGTKKLFKESDVTESTSELVLYKHTYTRTIEEAIRDKNIEFYFGGTERDRLDDYIEYVWRPEHVITTKSKFFNIENRVSRDVFMDYLDRAKYSVVITDIQNNRDHFISPRPYECYIHDIIPFFDHKYDPDGYYCSTDDFRRVHSYKEMREKMNYLNEHQEEYRKILEEQRQIVSNLQFVSGEHIYQKLK